VTPGEGFQNTPKSVTIFEWSL